MLLIAAMLVTLVVVQLVVVARLAEARAWRRGLETVRVVWPRSVDEPQMTAWLTSLAAITHRPNWSLLPLPPIVLETTASRSGIRHGLLLHRSNRPAVLSALQSAVPGVRVEPQAQPARPRPLVGLEVRLTTSARPLAIDRAPGTAGAVLASLQPLTGAAELRL